MEYLLTFGNVDDFNIEMNAIEEHLRNVFLSSYDITKTENFSAKPLYFRYVAK